MGHRWLTRPDRRRRANLALLVIVPAAVATGLFANSIGTDWPVDPAVLHAVVAFAVVAVSPWKSVTVRRGLRSWSAATWGSILLLALVVSTVATGLLHATGYQGRIGPLTVMQVHIGGAVVALVLLVAHYVAHPVRPRRGDLDRRAFLRTAGVFGAAGVAWLGWEGGLRVLGLRGAERRFTGSHERASHDPSRLPVTQWFDDRVQHLDAAGWSVRIAGRDLGLDDLAALPQDDVTAILDCTSGWWSEQVWTGVRLSRLIDPGDHRSVAVTSVTGYRRRYPARDLDRMWLVTHVGGEPLRPGNGFPARLVAPGRRGFWWVKWVAEIESSDVPWWLQLPFPVT